MLKGLSVVSLLLPLLLIVTCKEMPTDPFDDPRNLKVGFFLEGNKVSALAGDSILVGVTVNIPKLVKTLKSIDGEDGIERVLPLKNPQSTTQDTVFFKTMYKTPGSKTLTVRVMLTDDMVTDYQFEIVVLTPSNKVIFDTVPPKDTTVFDTKASVFHIVSHTVPSTVIKYTLSSSPVLPDSCYKIEGTGSASISVNPPKPGKYGLKITASNELVKDSFMMSLNVVAAPVVTVSSLNKVAQVGVADTLTFTGAEKDSLALENSDTFKSGEITLVTTGLKNVVKLVFTPRESKVYSFSLRVKGVTTDNIRYSDIIIVKHTVTGGETSVWKQDTLSISTAENSVISKSLDSLLVNSTMTGVSFVCDKGTITEHLWSDTIRWGARAIDTVVIIANYNGNTFPLKLFITTSAVDVSLPKIVLVDPSTADATISSNVITCKFTITDSLSGIGSVVFRIGTTVVSDTLHSGDTYLCTVRDLPKGVKTTLTVDAIDKSQKRNMASKDISLTYNPDIQDNVGPVISMKAPLVASFAVSSAATTVLIQCTDKSGIRSVTAKKGAEAVQVQKTDSIYSIVIGSLRAGKTDTVIVTAIDSSIASNPSTLPLYITYEPSMLDTNGPVIILKTPANNTSVSVSTVTMNVICRDESKIAAVTYKLGTLTGTMTKENDTTFTAVVSGLVSGKNLITISAKDASVNNKTTDSVFTITYDPTINDTIKPDITCPKATRDTLLVNSASATIEVSCTDLSGIDKVTCAMGTTAIPVTAGSGTLYSAMVSGLTAGANTFVFTATDKASKPNSTAKTIVVMYDPTATDVTGPVIKLSNPTLDRTKVAQPSIKLAVVCKDTNGISVVTYTFGSLSGAMTKENDGTYSVALVNLAKGDNQITVVAKDASSKNNASDTVFTIIYDPTMNDTVAPVITLKTPDKDNATVGSKSMTIEVVCTDSSGIDTVTCKAGNSDVAVVRGTGGVFSASVIMLAPGSMTFIFTATDKASTKHSSTKSVTIVYDPTIGDSVAPIVTIKNPQNADSRVLTDSITVKIDCTDDNKISSVTATRGGNPVTGITNVGSLYSVKVEKLTLGKSDTINFKVVDSSSIKNTRNFPVILRYNTQPTAAKLVAPVDGATGVAKSPTFTWSEGSDPDGDAVTYTLRYGTSATALSGTFSNLTAKTFTIAQAQVLSEATKYYWQVVTYTKVNGDSAVSGVASFTTIEDKPDITVEPTTQTVALGSTATFSVTAKGINNKYQWYNGTQSISNATLASFTTGVTTPSDDGALYRCIVSNNGGSDTSTSAILTLTYRLIYDANGGNGSVPSDSKSYLKGGSASLLDGTGLTNANAVFSGWSRSTAGGTKVYKPGVDTVMFGTGNLVLYAVWNATYTVTYYGNNNDGGTAPVDYSRYVQGAPVTVASVGTLSRSGYTFTGWNTLANGTGTARTAGSTFTLGNGNVTLYAQWNALPTHPVTYHANGGGIAWGHGSGGTLPETRSYAEGSTVTVPGNTGNLTKTAYTFDGWSRTQTYGINDPPVTSFTMGNTDVTLYARWVIMDASGNKYDEVVINGRAWMVQNLRTTKFNDKTDIPLSNSGGNYEMAKVHPGDETYGAYYNGYAAAQDTNDMLSPPGWHIMRGGVPYAEFQYACQGIARNLASTQYWKTGSSTDNAPGQQPSLNNSSGFNAIPSGYFSGQVFQRGEQAEFWLISFTTDEEYDYTTGQTMYLNWDQGQIFTKSATMTDYHSVRCMRDF